MSLLLLTQQPQEEALNNLQKRQFFAILEDDFEKIAEIQGLILAVNRGYCLN